MFALACVLASAVLGRVVDHLPTPEVTANTTSTGTKYTRTKVVYGKYYTKDPKTGEPDSECNTFYLYSPAGLKKDAPIIVEYHGGGFTSGIANTEATAEIEQYLDAGFHYASMDYRLTQTKYYFKNPKTGEEREEEFIRVDREGHLTIDPNRTLSSYKVRMGRQEYVTKCQFDAVQGFERVLAMASDSKIDVHSIGFTGGSAGGGEINYLTWVYHEWHKERYTPKSMVYLFAQLNYPVQNMISEVYEIFARDMGADTHFSDIVAFSSCPDIVANIEGCPSTNVRRRQAGLLPTRPPIETDVCNKTWQAEAMKFCASEEVWNKTTLRELAQKQTWVADDEQSMGMERLWFTERNMARYQPKDISIMIANPLNGTAWIDVVHYAVYARRYGQVAERAGIKHVVYYSDYADMPPEARTEEQVEFHMPAYPLANVAAGTWKFNYRHNIPFRSIPEIKKTGVYTVAEQLLFHKLAMGLPLTLTGPAN